MNPGELRRALQEVDEVTGIAAIARRYFAMNAFDGVITVLGLLAGTWAADVTDARVIVTAGAATCLAMGISGVTGAYLSEGAEREREVHELETQMLTDLGDTRIGRASRRAVWIVTVVDGASPLVAGLIPLGPYLVSGWLPDPGWAFYGAVGVALVELVSLGAFLGIVSRGRVWVYVVRTLAAGIVALLAGLALHLV